MGLLYLYHFTDNSLSQLQETVSRDEGVALHVRSIRRSEVIRTAAVLRLGAAGTVLLVGSLRPKSCQLPQIFPGRCGIKSADWKKFAHYVLCKDYVSHNLEWKLTLENFSLLGSKVQPLLGRFLFSD